MNELKAPFKTSSLDLSSLYPPPHAPVSNASLPKVSQNLICNFLQSYSRH